MSKGTITIPCHFEGCKHCKFVAYSSQKERNEIYSRNTNYLCLRHEYPNKQLMPDNPKTEVTLYCKTLMYRETEDVLGNFWQEQKEWESGSKKVLSGHQSGNGYMALADDFPQGTILKVTAEIILP